jgi:hypothetical protein
VCGLPTACCRFCRTATHPSEYLNLRTYACCLQVLEDSDALRELCLTEARHARLHPEKAAAAAVAQALGPVVSTRQTVPLQAAALVRAGARRGRAWLLRPP